MITLKRSHLTIGVLVALAAIGTAIAVALWPTAQAGTVELHGTLTLHGKTLHDGSGLCMGQGGYSDIAEGATVTVYNASGTIVATDKLGRGDDRGWKPYDDTDRSNTCWFPFTVSTPKAEIYQVEVSHRGKVTVSGSETDHVELTLGM